MATVHDRDDPPHFDAVLASGERTALVVLDFHGTVTAVDPQWPGPIRSQRVRASFGAFPIVWAQGLRDQVNALACHRRAQLVWATSWGPEITRIEDLLDLPRLPRAIDVLLPHNQVAAAKRTAIAAVGRTGRPYVWCDDRLAGRAPAIAGAGPRLEIRPASQHGLGPAEVERIWAFVDNPSTVLDAQPADGEPKVKS